MVVSRAPSLLQFMILSLSPSLARSLSPSDIVRACIHSVFNGFGIQCYSLRLSHSFLFIASSSDRGRKEGILFSCFPRSRPLWHFSPHRPKMKPSGARPTARLWPRCAI